MPELETLSDPGHTSAPHAAPSTSQATQQSTVVVEDADDDSPPTAGTSASASLPHSASAVLEPIDTNTVDLFQTAELPDLLEEEDVTMLSPELPSALQQEMNLHQAVSFTAAELEEIPDMNAPSSQDEDADDDEAEDGDGDNDEEEAMSDDQDEVSLAG